MANLPRFVKSGSSWSRGELEAYNITIVEQDQGTFFGGPLLSYSGPLGFLQHEDLAQGLDAPSLSLLKRLDLTREVKENEESAVDDFTTELLRVLGYETDQTVVRTRKNIRLSMCGEEVYAKADVCVLGVGFKILLFVQEEKLRLGIQDAEPQLIAEAIAAFQVNNRKRVNDLFLDPLENELFPGITMAGTFPRFYKIRVTSELDHCVRHGLYPTTQTIVYRHTPRIPGRRGEGMRSLDNRELIVRCFETFKRFVSLEEG